RLTRAMKASSHPVSPDINLNLLPVGLFRQPEDFSVYLAVDVGLTAVLAYPGGHAAHYEQHAVVFNGYCGETVGCLAVLADDALHRGGGYLTGRSDGVASSSFVASAWRRFQNANSSSTLIPFVSSWIRNASWSIKSTHLKALSVCFIASLLGISIKAPVREKVLCLADDLVVGHHRGVQYGEHEVVGHAVELGAGDFDDAVVVAGDERAIPSFAPASPGNNTKLAAGHARPRREALGTGDEGLAGGSVEEPVGPAGEHI